MSKRLKQSSAPSNSLFPFFSDIINHPRFGPGLAAVYFGVMLFIGLKYHVVGDYNVETDFFWAYVPTARKILRGIFLIEDFRGPAYPAILAVAGLVTRDFFRAGIILSILAGAATLFFSFELLKRLFRDDIALLSTLLIAVNSTFIQYSYTAGTDMVFNAFVAASAFFLLKDEERKWMDLGLSAFFASLAYLTRYNGIFVVLAVPVVVLFVNFFHLDWKERAKTTLLYIGVFFLLIAPWGIYCLVEKGSFFYNKNYLNIAYEMFAKGKVGWDQYWNVEATKFGSLGRVILADPALFVGTVLKNVYEHFTSDLGLLLGWHVGVFALIGIVLLFREKPTVRQTAFFLFGACYFVVLLLVFYGERFSMFLLPVYSVLAFESLTHQKLASMKFWKTVQAGALFAYVLLIWSFVDSYKFNRTNIDSGPQEVPVIADWFKRNVGPSESGKIIITRKPHIAYYLDMTMEVFPYVNTLDELQSEARRTGASYLYFGYMEAGMRPQFQQLLDPRKAPSWLRPLTYTVAPPAVLYKIDLDAKP